MYILLVKENAMTKKTAKPQKKAKAQALRQTPHPTLKRDLKLSLAITEDEGAIVDALGKLNARIAKLTKEAEAHKAALKATGKARIDGKRYYAVISERTTERLNTSKAKGYLTLEQIRDCTDVGQSTAVSLYDL